MVRKLFCVDFNLGARSKNVSKGSKRAKMHENCIFEGGS